MVRHAMTLTIVHLFERPALRLAVARLIHDEFWTSVPGASVERMTQRLTRAGRADRIPLCRVAVHGGQAIGVVNLVESDDDDHSDWSPWLAGLVVADRWRGRGVGSLLVRSLLDDARRMGLLRVYFGTDGPGFYTRLGAVQQQQPRPDFWFMRFDLEPVKPAGSSPAAVGRGCARRVCRRAPARPLRARAARARSTRA